MHISFDTAYMGETEARGIMALLAALFPFPSSSASSIAPDSTPVSQPKTVALTPGVELEKVAISQPEIAPEAIKRARKPRGAATNTSPDPATPPSPVKVDVADNATAKTVTADELRSHLNGYIARHSMEEALVQLESFGCRRVSEALNLEPAKLNALATVLMNGATNG
jgi:hypothetical protein